MKYIVADVYAKYHVLTQTKDGNLLLSCRHLDEVIKINKNTGNIMWRLGGEASKNNEFTFLNDTTDGFVGF